MIYQAQAGKEIRALPPLYAFWTFRDTTGDHWVLEVLDQLHIDGKSVNEQKGYQKSYLFSLLNGKPVFMFEKNGQFGLNVAGVEVLLPGTTVPHYNCCDATTLNPWITNQGLSFFLRNGEHVEYVEMVVR